MRRIQLCCRRFAALACLTVVFASIPTVQGQVVDRDGTAVEFIGLEEWTPERIDAILTGGREVAPYYCAANLTGQVGMADAAVMHQLGRDGKRSILVVVMEPQYADRVVYRPAPTMGAVHVDHWESLARDLERPTADMQRALMSYGQCLAAGATEAHERLAQSGRGAAVDPREAWARFEALRTPEDFDRAVWALAHDSDSRTRSVAAVVLAGFPERDLALYSLVDGIRDADARVRGTCNQLLTGWTRSLARPVDWEPALDSLRHLVGGTNLFALPNVLDLLNATEIAPELAADLVGGRAEILLALADAQHEPTRAKARGFLSRLAGRDLGSDLAAWEAWVDDLGVSKDAESVSRTESSRE